MGVLNLINFRILETALNREKYFCISIGQNLFYDLLHLSVWCPFIYKIKMFQYNLFNRNVMIICFHKQLSNCNATALLPQAHLRDIYAVQQDTQSFLVSEFIQHLRELYMFRTSPVHHQERFFTSCIRRIVMW